MNFNLKILRRRLILKMDYAMPGKRKTKGDKKAKRRYNKYKKGGHARVEKKKDSD
jgi:hypothetical protein